VAKKGKDIAPTSLQTAYNPDATYRWKGNKDHVGYTYNVTKTFDEKNPFSLLPITLWIKTSKPTPKHLPNVYRHFLPVRPAGSRACNMVEN